MAIKQMNTLNPNEQGGVRRGKNNENFTELDRRIKTAGAVDWTKDDETPTSAAIELRINAKAPAMAVGAADAVPIQTDINKLFNITHGLANRNNQIIPHDSLANNFWILDRYGNANLMVYVPAFNWTLTKKFDAMGRPSENVQAAAGVNVTLSASSSSENDFYKGCLIIDRTAGHNNQVRKITGYVGATRIATIDLAFTLDPAQVEVTALHPAFLTADVAGNILKKKGFYIAKVKGVIINNLGVIQNFETARSGVAYNTGDKYRALNLCAHSRLGLAPQVSIDYDAAIAACEAMNNVGSTVTTGKFMSSYNYHWAALALWTRHQTIVLSKPWPRGNNLYGYDVDDRTVRFKQATTDTGILGVSSNWRSLGGSGGSKTAHNLDPSGVYDMNGNVYEWQAGAKSIDGQIFVSPIAINAGEPIYAGGNGDINEVNYLATGHYFNNPNAAGGGVFSISKADRGFSNEGILNNDYNTIGFNGINPAGIDDYIKALALAPVDYPSADYNSDLYYVRNWGERLPLRAGCWNDSSNAGLFCAHFDYLRSYGAYTFGFRPAFEII